MTDAEKYFHEYLDYLEIEKNRSLKTRENYAHYLEVFLKETGVKKPSWSARPTIITNKISYLLIVEKCNIL